MKMLLYLALPYVRPYMSVLVVITVPMSLFCNKIIVGYMCEDQQWNIWTGIYLSGFTYMQKEFMNHSMENITLPLAVSALYHLTWPRITKSPAAISQGICQELDRQTKEPTCEALLFLLNLAYKVVGWSA